MKLTIAIFAIVVMISCGNKKETIKAGREEKQTVFVFKDTVTKTLHASFGYRIVDRYAKLVDSVNLKSEWAVDTLGYILVYSMPRIDSITKKQLLDTAGNPATEIKNKFINKSLVVFDGGFDVIAALQKEFPVKDSTLNKQ